MVAKIILSRPKIGFDARCPKCKTRQVVSVPIVDYNCSNCKTHFQEEVQVSIYFTIAKKLIQATAHNNEVVIVGERSESVVFHTKDELKPRSKNDDDIFHTMLAIKHDFELQKNIEVSDITTCMDFDYMVSCTSCGTCRNCVVCSHCNKSYVPKKVKSGEKRFTCPDCGLKHHRPTLAKLVDGKCQYCGSAQIHPTKFAAAEKCPKCGGDKISPARKIPVYKLVLKRQPRFELEEVKEDD